MKLTGKKVVLNVQYFGKIAAVKMSIVFCHGKRFMSCNLLYFEGMHIGHEEGCIQEVPPVVNGDSALSPLLSVHADSVKSGSGFPVDFIPRKREFTAGI